MTEPEPTAGDTPDESFAEADGWDAEEPDAHEDTERTGGIGSLRGDHNVSITDPRGSVVIMEQVAFHLRSAAGEGESAWAPRLVPEDILTNLAERFVRPSGYGDLVAGLRNPGTVVVTGASGCGRRAAALMVLKESGEGATRFRELPDEDTEERFVLDSNVLETGERLLLDLSAWTTPVPSHVIAGLRAYRAAVAERQAYLTIVLPLEQQKVAAELGAEAVLIRRPDGAEVFRRHLAVFGIEAPVHEMHDETLRGHLDHDPMRDIAALADRVRRARGEAAGHGDWRAWLAAALKTDSYVDVVAQFVRDNPDGRVRALLLSAAVFEHASPEVVVSAAAAFLEIVKYPPHDGHRLDLPDLAEALGRVHATIDGLQVRFSSVAYADAVRTHFWRTFPDLRVKLRQWIDKAVRLRAVSHHGRSMAVLRYTDQCLRTGHPDDLSVLVEQWAGRSGSTSDKWLDVAGVALTRGLLNEQYGRLFRRRVYDWVVNRRLAPSLATLLVGLCEGVIAPARPDQALVRLRHLTRHHHAKVVAEAHAALIRLCRDGLFARRMLARVHEDLTGAHPRDVDYVLFTDVADPVRLTGGGTYPRVEQQAVRAMLIDGWAALLTTRSDAQIAAALRRWLDAHAEKTGRHALLEILAAATRGRSPQCAALYVVSRDWVAMATPDQRPARARTAALLRQACADVRSRTSRTYETRSSQGVSH